jgi:hypothetical protein
MKHASVILAAVMFAALANGPVSAQFIPPGSSTLNPPLPAPPPPPKIEVPAIPQMDTPSPSPYVSPAPGASFGDRIRACLDDAAAAGLNPADRAAYSRSCANR